MPRKDARPARKARTEAARDTGAKGQIKEYKESLIIDAAARLFSEKGFQRTTLDDIGAALGVTKPFIYTYFKSKDSILERLFERVIDEVFENAGGFRELPEGDAVRRFEHFVSAHIHTHLDPESYPALMLEEEKHLRPEKLAALRVKQRQFHKMLTKLIADGVAAGVFSVNDPAIASQAISSVVRWAHRWYSPAGRLSAEQVSDEIRLLALRIVGWNGRYASAAGKDQPAPRRKA